MTPPSWLMIPTFAVLPKVPAPTKIAAYELPPPLRMSPELTIPPEMDAELTRIAAMSPTIVPELAMVPLISPPVPTAMPKSAVTAVPAET